MMTSCEPALPRVPPAAAHNIRLHISIPTGTAINPQPKPDRSLATKPGHFNLLLTHQSVPDRAGRTSTLYSLKPATNCLPGSSSWRQMTAIRKSLSNCADQLRRQALYCRLSQRSKPRRCGLDFAGKPLQDAGFPASLPPEAARLCPVRPPSVRRRWWHTKGEKVEGATPLFAFKVRHRAGMTIAHFSSHFRGGALPPQ